MSRPTLSPAEILDARIAAARVPRAKPHNLRLARWNIRELGKKARLDGLEIAPLVHDGGHTFCSGSRASWNTFFAAIIHS